ncbi:hypothetical protein T484DRAFT_1813369 [Baffinella frigidus]|nr:hypothetical protein T484DRAFT_1813369 [Cryptophyta sp. CCMP2293]
MQVIGADAANTLIIWDWRSKTPLFGTKTGGNPILAAAFSPRVGPASGASGGSLMTCGVQHAAFFALTSNPRRGGKERGSGAGSARVSGRSDEDGVPGEERLEGKMAVWGRTHRPQTLMYPRNP